MCSSDLKKVRLPFGSIPFLLSLFFSFIRKILFYINRYINLPPTLYLYQRSISRVTHPLPLINLRNPFYRKYTCFMDPITSFAIYSEGSTFRENMRHSLILDIFHFPSLCHSSGSLGNRLNKSFLFSTLPSVVFLQQLVPSAIILMSSSLKKFGIMLCPFAFYIDTSVPMGFRPSLFRFRQWIV